RRDVSPGGDFGLGLEYRRRLCRAGFRRPQHVLRRRRLCAAADLHASGLAVLIGTPTFRLSGHYFSMATIAVAELIRIFVGTWDFVGAAIGLQGPATARGWWDLTFRSQLPYDYIFLAVLGVVLATTAFIERRRFGFYLRAIKASERAARSLGVPVRRTKMQA